MKKMKWVVWMLVGILLVGCNKSEEANSGQVTTEKIEAEVQEGIDVFGEITANQTKEIYIDFPATVEKLYVKEGDCVKKGDKLATLDIKSYETSILKKEKEMELLEVQLGEFEKNLDPTSVEASKIKQELLLKERLLQEETDPELKMQTEEIAEAERVLAKARKDYEVLETLYVAGSLAKNEVDEAQLGIQSKEKTLKEAEAKLEKAKTEKQLELDALAASLKVKQTQASNTSYSNKSEIDELIIRRSIAEVELEEMQSRLRKSYIKGKDIIAETDSIVEKLGIQEGCLVGRDGQGVALKLVDETSLVATVDIPESFIKDVKLGSQAEVKCYADEEQVIKGQISRIAHKAIEESGETIVKADVTLAGHGAFIKLGYGVDVKILK
ncbi:hypothetical protein CS063_06060 [Sporanaerobium hydrogeniformans]|uniref:Uncharacterized protein n=1 Tax=Sporanaerobium hydrogeniformans TaxID=3072179 RepID=A0AC61DDX1_9FIRM|nr:HlyD family efflux transporter periplasmic adaptor subunit [Sporanaerobium hydrogeniformans]PHV71253.1 hypothetical protein CS063_06060 [Sporanaerobium hydrogeniformans]